MVKEFAVLGKVYSKARPRFKHITTKSGKEMNITYNNNTTVSYEKKIKSFYKKVYSGSDIIENAFIVEIGIYFKIPKSTPKKKMPLYLNGDIYAVKPPDIDNVKKIVMDALNGLAYKDDRYCIGSKVYKAYSKGEEYLTVKISDNKEDIEKLMGEIELDIEAYCKEHNIDRDSFGNEDED